MTDELIPFGKYKGQPLVAIQKDKQYIDWLLAQSWFHEKHKEFYTIIINNFQEAVDTPQHNAMHVKFLDDAYVLNLFKEYQIGDKDNYVVSRCFERDGWDVIIELSGLCTKDISKLTNELLDKWNESNDEEYRSNLDKEIMALENIERIALYIEIKPTVSDDFPSILRQIKASRITRKSTTKIILLVGEYTGIGATKDEFVAFMWTEGVTVIFDGKQN